MSSDHPDYIVVEGPIGVGKTTLARRLAATFGTDLVLEGADANPFLTRFYSDPRGAALPTQLFFLFQRVQQIQSMRQADLFKPVQVADFLMEKDRLFAEITLSADELELYDQVAARLAIEAPQPDLVIYLQAPAPVLMRRIAARGIPHEAAIEQAYLERLIDAYVRFFHHYDAAPLLIVNASEVDFARGERDYALLLDHLRKVPAGRHYFNPTAL